MTANGNPGQDAPKTEEQVPAGDPVVITPVPFKDELDGLLGDLKQALVSLKSSETNAVSAVEAVDAARRELATAEAEAATVEASKTSAINAVSSAINSLCARLRRWQSDNGLS